MFIPITQENMTLPIHHEWLPRGTSERGLRAPTGMRAGMPPCFGIHFCIFSVEKKKKKPSLGEAPWCLDMSCPAVPHTYVHAQMSGRSYLCVHASPFQSGMSILASPETYVQMSAWIRRL